MIIFPWILRIYYSACGLLSDRNNENLLYMIVAIALKAAGAMICKIIETMKQSKIHYFLGNLENQQRNSFIKLISNFYTIANIENVCNLAGVHAQQVAYTNSIHKLKSYLAAAYTCRDICAEHAVLQDVSS
jgi:hypothetical protein